MGWAEQEFETIDLGDPRLNRRAVLLAERLGQKPGASIPGACENWAETAAAYRFLRNEQVNCEDVLGAHRQATIARMREHAVVLCLQDTTELDYNGQAMTGLGPLSYEAQRGLLLHPTYVVTPEREPLGVMNAWTWAREFKQGDAPRGGMLFYFPVDKTSIIQGQWEMDFTTAGVFSMASKANTRSSSKASSDSKTLL